MLAGTFDHDPVPVGKLFDPCWHFSRSRQRLIAPMPLLAYLAGQRDPDGHMIIVALDLNVGMEIDVCHFPPVGCQNLAIVAGQAFQAARSYSLMRPPRTGRRLIFFWERSATGGSGRGGLAVPFR